MCHSRRVKDTRSSGPHSKWYLQFHWLNHKKSKKRIQENERDETRRKNHTTRTKYDNKCNKHKMPKKETKQGEN